MDATLSLEERMTDASNVKFVGVDGCKAGWFSVCLDNDGGYDVGVHPHFVDLLDHYGSESLFLVDIPIGLIESGSAERRCDVEARKRLERRKSSVFRVPTRAAVHKATLGEASEAEERLTGKRIGSTSWGIVSKIREVDLVMRNLTSGERKYVKEVHPELLFWGLNDRQDMGYNKKRPLGHAERMAVLRRFEPSAQDVYKTAFDRWLRKEVARDDILDALAAAVTARLGYPDKLQTLPANPPKDEHGLRMEMVFYNPPS